jgi:4-oxalocrotonate tautomerase
MLGMINVAGEEAQMPVAKVYVPEGILTPDQRREIVKGIHDVIVSVEKQPSYFPTYVLINEVAAGDWGSSGKVYAPRS